MSIKKEEQIVCPGCGKRIVYWLMPGHMITAHLYHSPNLETYATPTVADKGKRPGSITRNGVRTEYDDIPPRGY